MTATRGHGEGETRRKEDAAALRRVSASPPLRVSVPTPHSDNPDIALVGRGPEGCRCGECGNLGAVRVPTRPTRKEPTNEPGQAIPEPSADQTIYFCTLSGQAKRVTWPACANFLTAKSEVLSLRSKVGDRALDSGLGT